jgi:hypothetical protein
MLSRAVICAIAITALALIASTCIGAADPDTAGSVQNVPVPTGGPERPRP